MCAGNATSQISGALGVLLIKSEKRTGTSSSTLPKYCYSQCKTVTLRTQYYEQYTNTTRTNCNVRGEKLELNEPFLPDRCMHDSTRRVIFLWGFLRKNDITAHKRSTFAKDLKPFLFIYTINTCIQLHRAELRAIVAMFEH